MLALSKDLFIAAGANRQVYFHPVHPRWCVKIFEPTSGRRDESAREIRESERLLRTGCDFRHMPRFHQWVPTNYGMGTVWDLVRNYDGSIALSLLESLATERLHPLVCRAELQRFQEWCLQFGVITHDVHPRNLMCQFVNRREVRFVLVDGGGNNEFIPVSEWFTAVRRRKVARHWERFLKKFDDMVNDLPSAASTQTDACPNWRLHRRAA